MMDSLAINAVTRKTRDAVFDAGIALPDNAFERAKLGVSKLAGIDDAFERAVASTYNGKAGIVDVYSRIAKDGLDRVAAAITAESGRPAAEVRESLTRIQDLVSRSAYWDVLPAGAAMEVFITGTGDLVTDPTKAPPNKASERVGLLHKLAVQLSSSSSNMLEGLPELTRDRVMAHIADVIKQVEGGGQNPTTGVSKTSTPNLAIPDNNRTGATDIIHVDEAGAVGNISVALNIEHTYIGDLNVQLIAPDGQTATLHKGSGGSADNINKTYTVGDSDLAQLRGVDMDGDWKLKIVDSAGQDVGKLVDWKLDIEGQSAAGRTSTPNLAIADMQTVEDSIVVRESGQLTSIGVDVDIDHTYQGDLVVNLVAPDGTVCNLHNKAGRGTDDLKRSYGVNNADLKALLDRGVDVQGEWKLTVQDTARQDQGTFNSWKLNVATEGGGGTAPDLTEPQQKAFFAGAGAILRRLVASGNEMDKMTAFNTAVDLVKKCPFNDVKILDVAGLKQTLDHMPSAAKARFDADVAPLVAPKSPMYDDIFQISYVDGQPVAAKRELNCALFFGSEDDDLIKVGGQEMLVGKGFEKVESDKSGFLKYTKKVNQDDADEPCQAVNVYVYDSYGSSTNLFKCMSDPDIDVIQYDGHSNLGRNIEDSLKKAPALTGNKIVILGACATTDRMFRIRHKYQNPHRVQLINTYESTYFNWKEVDGKKVMNYSENMMGFFGLTTSMSKGKDWQAMNADLKRATHSWSHSVDINYTNPGKLEWLMLVDLDRDGVPDGVDSVWDGGRVVPNEVVREEWQARAPSMALGKLDASKVYGGVHSLDTFGRYNELVKKAYTVRTLRSGGFDPSMTLADPMVKVTQTSTRGWKISVNPNHSHASQEAIRCAMHYEFIDAAMKAGVGRNLSPVDAKIFKMHYVASSLRFDNSYYDDRVWDGFLEAYNLPSTPLSDFFHVIDVEHDRPGHALTGGYRNIAEVKERLSPEVLAALESEDAGKWVG